MWLVTVLACVASPDTDSSPSTSVDSATTGLPTDTAGTDSVPTDTAPVDADGDGVSAATDCNDGDDDVYPGAPEAWDGKDGDCDGRVDADGHYEGSIHVDAVAIYEGVARGFSLDCPTTLDRGGGVLAVEMICTPDPTDELAQLLLGATLSLTAGDDQMGGATWSGVGELRSSNGWDAAPDLGLTWPDLDTSRVSWSLDTRSLDASGSGTLTWAP